MTEKVANGTTVSKENGNERLTWLRDNGFVITLEFKNDKGQVVDTAEAVNYWGVLHLAHEEGLKRVTTGHIQLPAKDNLSTAIFWAEVETKKGVFKKYGDANPENVNSRVRKHLIRVAETRAVARALRDAVDIGLVCAEELESEVDTNGLARKLAAAKIAPNGDKPPTSSKPDAPPAAAAAPVKPKSPQGQRGGNGNKAEHKPAERTEAVSPKAQTSRLPVPSAGPNGDYRMSDRQRNYLFRLVSDLGHQGEEAHEFLKEKLQVESLKLATKQQANEIITELLRVIQEEKVELPF